MLESERVVEEHRGKENSARGFSLLSITLAAAMVAVGNLYWWVVTRAQRVPDTRPEPEVFFNTRSVPDLISKSSGISGIGYFIKLCFWLGKLHQGGKRYWLTSSYIIFIWPKWTGYCGPISMGLSSIIMSPLCFLGFSILLLHYIVARLSMREIGIGIAPEVMGWTCSQRCQRKMWTTELEFKS